MKTLKNHNHYTIIFTKVIDNFCGELNNGPPKISMF